MASVGDRLEICHWVTSRVASLSNMERERAWAHQIRETKSSEES